MFSVSTHKTSKDLPQGPNHSLEKIFLWVKCERGGSAPEPAGPSWNGAAPQPPLASPLPAEQSLDLVPRRARPLASCCGLCRPFQDGQPTIDPPAAHNQTLTSPSSWPTHPPTRNYILRSSLWRGKGKIAIQILLNAMSPVPGSEEKSSMSMLSEIKLDYVVQRVRINCLLIKK